METFKDIKGYEGLYKISDNGNVLSCARITPRGYNLKAKYLTPVPIKKGYLRVGLRLDNELKNKTKMFSIHRLIALTFLPNPESKTEVNHKNGIKTDNRLENLEWCTGSENMKHAFKNGLISHLGERSPKAKLDSKKVRIIKYASNVNRHNKMKLYFVLSKMFNVSIDTIQDVIHGKTWGHILIPR